MRGRQRPTPWSSSSCSWHLGRLSTAKHGRALLEKRIAALADVIAFEGAPAQGRDLASFAIGEAALGGGVEQAEDPLHSLHRQIGPVALARADRDRGDVEAGAERPVARAPEDEASHLVPPRRGARVGERRQAREVEGVPLAGVVEGDDADRTEILGAERRSTHSSTTRTSPSLTA